jgi:hypothetical protein
MSITGADRGASDVRASEPGHIDRPPGELRAIDSRVAVEAGCGADSCEIAGACIASGQADPANSCRVCDPSFGRTTWAPAPGCIITLAGGAQGFADGPVGAARFNTPEDILVEGPGTVLVADSNNNRIRRIAAGTVATIAGDGTPGWADGPAGSAMFHYPHGLGMDSTGRVFVTDLEGHRVRMIDGSTVSTVAGDGTSGHLDGPAALARFRGPYDVAVAAGKLFVADLYAVRIIESGNVTTLTGDGTPSYVDGAALNARFNGAYGITVTSVGRAYVADRDNNAIRVIFNGVVTTLCGGGAAGFADGPTSTAKLGAPEGIAMDASGALYFSEHGACAIREVANNMVTTIAGSSPYGFQDGPLSGAKLDGPTGVGVDSAGRIYVGDTSNHRIRVIRLP